MNITRNSNDCVCQLAITGTASKINVLRSDFLGTDGKMQLNNIFPFPEDRVGVAGTEWMAKFWGSASDIYESYETYGSYIDQLKDLGKALPKEQFFKYETSPTLWVVNFVVRDLPPLQAIKKISVKYDVTCEVDYRASYDYLGDEKLYVFQSGRVICHVDYFATEMPRLYPLANYRVQNEEAIDNKLTDSVGSNSYKKLWKKTL